jgi:uncharacterized protein YutE (UPF0331/DUF86 family)
MTRDVIHERLDQLEVNLDELQQLSEEFTKDDLQAVTRVQWAIRYGLFESIQIVIDVMCHISSQKNLGNTSSYRHCVEKLQQFGYITAETAVKVKGMIGLRNVLVHEYVRIDHTRLHELLNNLDDLRSLIPILRSA